MTDYTKFQNPNIYAFMKKNHIAVLATATKDGKPYAATVYYATDSKLNVFFVTKDRTQKSRILTENPRAAVVVYEADTQTTVQISGNVSVVDNPEMLAKALRMMSGYSKETAGTEETPIEKLNSGNYLLYKISPESIRMGEFKYGPRNQLFDVGLPAEDSLE